MKIEINKHYSVLSNGEIICITDYPKNTQEDAENFAQCIENQALDVCTHDGLWVHFIKNKDCQSSEIGNAVKSIFDDNGFITFDVLNLVYPLPSPHRMTNIDNMTSTEVAVLICCKW